jgi:hypothetical protein
MELSNLIERRRAYRSLEPVSVDNDLVSGLAGSAGLSHCCFNGRQQRPDQSCDNISSSYIRSKKSLCCASSEASLSSSLLIPVSMLLSARSV